MTIDAMFRDNRWLSKRDQLLECAEWSCVECGADADKEFVHVCFYPKGMMLWDFPEPAFKVLCPEHRERRSAFERELRRRLTDFTTSGLGVFLDVFEQFKELDPAQAARAMEELRGAVKRGAAATAETADD